MTSLLITPGLEIDNLERILMEAGLSVEQSGGEYAKVKMIEDRLDQDDSEAANTLRELREQSGERAVTTALGAFYLCPAAGETGGGVEFYHKSFSEFLCAKRLQESIEEWTETSRRRRRWSIDDQELARQIYDLLGYGGLTPEIVKYLMGLFKKSDEFKPVELFERLEDFYLRWCDGEFIDADGTTFPQTKMRELKQQLPVRDTYLGQRQVDVYAGLNIMILLLELHRYGQNQEDYTTKEKLTFYPCGKNNDKDHNRFLHIIAYSLCLNHIGFRKTLGSFLKKVDLSGASLYRADFIHANLSEANLRDTNLCRADLRFTNLRFADLSGSDLRYADLVNSNLGNANLEGANLEGADLERANLEGSNLRNANLRRPNLKEINFKEARLQGANLQGANLFSANFFQANLQDAILKGAYFKEAKFLRANLANADFARANLRLAHFSGANLEGANLEEANLEEAKFFRTNLEAANLEGANLRDAKFINNTGISESLKQNLIGRGVIFVD